METLLRKYEPVTEHQGVPTPASAKVMATSNPTPSGLIATYGTSSFSPPSRHCMSDDPQTQTETVAAADSNDKELNGILSGYSSGEIVELGLEEPLPPQEILEDLYEVCLSRRMYRTDPLQDSDLLPEYSPHVSYDQSIPVSGSHESVTKGASSNCIAVCNVDARGFHHK